MQTVTSADGTRIAYETHGAGPPLILVDGALCSRAFGPSPKLAAALADRFTVVAYDRRGRGGSGDAPAYDKAREIEDLAALVEAVGGRASLLGLSSGAALALEAAAAGVPVDRVAAYEPPYMPDDHARHATHEQRLRALLAAGRRGDMVKYFMRDMVGAPGFVLVMMRLLPGVWRKLCAVAHTLPYDAAVMSAFQVPTARFAAVRAPTLVLHGGKTEPRLASAARAVAAAVPGARHDVVAGEDHDVAAKKLAPIVTSFLQGGAA